MVVIMCMSQGRYTEVEARNQVVELQWLVSYIVQINYVHAGPVFETLSTWYLLSTFFELPLFGSLSREA